MNKGKVKKIIKYVLLGIGLAFVLILAIQFIRCKIAVSDAVKRLENYDSKSIELSYGDMTYIDSGEGEAILSIHGIFGGYDQAFDTCKDLVDKYRVLAPSRFGYLGIEIQEALDKFINAP